MLGLGLGFGLGFGLGLGGLLFLFLEHHVQPRRLEGRLVAPG